MNLAGVLVASAMALEVVCAQNRVRNGSMDDGEEKPNGWTLYAPKGVEMVRDTQCFQSAPAALRMDVSDDGKHSVYQVLEGDVSGTYRVRLSIKAEGEGIKQVQPFVHVMGSDWKSLQWQSLGYMRQGGWMKVEKDVTVPAGAGHVQVGVMGEGHGRIWVDDVDVVSVGGRKGSEDALNTGLSVPVSDCHIHTVGRFEKTSNSVICAWSASEIRCAFQGTGDVGIQMPRGAGNRIQAVVDGVDQPAVTIESGRIRYPLAHGLASGTHEVSVYKITEANCGLLEMASIELPAGAALVQPVARKRKIEVIGDSISCGYGNEAASKESHFSSQTENACRTYGAITARHFGADYTCVAWSGKKMSPDNTLPALYDRTLPQKDGSVWRFEGDVPDVFLINLCTNDAYGKTPLDEERWVSDYLAFVARLRGRAPDAMIYCAVGPMLWSDKLERFRRLVRSVVRTRTESGDTRVRFLEFEPQKMHNGIGADWHPSVKTHEVMANAWIGALTADMGW